MQRHPRLVKIFCNVLIKVLILFLGNFRLVARPQRRSRIDRFFARVAEVQHNRVVDMLGVGMDDVPEVNRIGVVFGVVLKKQFDVRTVSGFFRFGYFKTVHAVGNPFVGFVAVHAPGRDFHLCRHHKRRIKADAELADKVNG